MTNDYNVTNDHNVTKHVTSDDVSVTIDRVVTQCTSEDQERDKLLTKLNFPHRRLGCFSPVLLAYLIFFFFLPFFRLGYATAADVIELKGRVACELSR